MSQTSGLQPGEGGRMSQDIYNQTSGLQLGEGGRDKENGKPLGNPLLVI